MGSLERLGARAADRCRSLEGRLRRGRGRGDGTRGDDDDRVGVTRSGEEFPMLLLRHESFFELLFSIFSNYYLARPLVVDKFD